MYGIYANMWGILMVNVTIYGIHGSYGIWIIFARLCQILLGFSSSPKKFRRVTRCVRFQTPFVDSHAMTDLWPERRLDDSHRPQRARRAMTFLWERRSSNFFHIRFPGIEIWWFWYAVVPTSHILATWRNIVKPFEQFSRSKHHRAPLKGTWAAGMHSPGTWPISCAIHCCLNLDWD